MSNRKQAAAELRRALQLYARDLAGSGADDSTMMEIASLYPDWQPDHTYALDDVIKYGVNADGETQLYRVLRAHTSQADWVPDATASLYKAIGYTEDGTPIWTQPLGSGDLLYQSGDVVEHNGQRWISTIDNNVWEPGVYGWEPVSD